VGGQSDTQLASAHAEAYVLDLLKRASKAAFVWPRAVDCPGGPRGLHAVGAQYSTAEECLYAMGARREEAGKVVFLNDPWMHNRMGKWRQGGEMPRAVAAAPAVAVGKHSIYLLGGDDGSRFDQTDELRDQHPGFSRQALVYITAEERWESS